MAKVPAPCTPRPRSKSKRRRILSSYYYPVNVEQKTIINAPFPSMASYSYNWRLTEFVRICGAYLNFARQGKFADFRIVERPQWI